MLAQMTVEHIVKECRYGHALAEQVKYACQPAVGLITDIGLLAVDVLPAAEIVPDRTAGLWKTVGFSVLPSGMDTDSVSSFPLSSSFSIPSGCVFGHPSASVSCAMISFRRSSFTFINSFLLMPFVCQDG